MQLEYAEKEAVNRRAMQVQFDIPVNLYLKIYFLIQDISKGIDFTKGYLYIC